MGTVTQTIGTASRNFSTIALWEAALPASLVTDGNSYVGQCFADTEFDLSTTALTIGGSTTDATHTITLTTGAGQGFKDNASAGSNALRYNASNGVAIKGNVAYDYIFKITDNFVTIQNLQFLNSAANANGCIRSDGTDFEIDNSIVQVSGGNPGSSGTLIVVGARSTVKNSASISDTSVACHGLYVNTDATLINNTVVRPSNRTVGGVGINCHYGTVTVQNCVVAGFTTATSKGSATLSGSGNAIDTGSYATGLSGQVSLTIATEFVQPSNASSVMDWRLNSTSVACKDNGTNSGAPTTDIIGQAISNTTRDVGAWELQQSGGAVSATLTGTSSTSAAGTITVTGTANVNLTGASGTSAVGTLTASLAISANVTGASSSGQVGILTETAFANTLTTGVSSTSAANTVTVTGFANVPFTGNAATGSAGDVTVTTAGTVSVSLTGVSSTAAVNTVTVTGFANQTLFGVESKGAVGSFTETAPANVSITGVSSTAAVGTITVSIVSGSTALLSSVTATSQVGNLSASVPAPAGVGVDISNPFFVTLGRLKSIG